MIDATKLFSTAVGEALVEQNIDKSIERAAKNGLNITDTILCEFTSDTVIYENVDNVLKAYIKYGHWGSYHIDISYDSSHNKWYHITLCGSENVKKFSEMKNEST
jgi:hypothetical protein